MLFILNIIYIYILNNYLERWNGVEGVGMGMSWRVVEGVGEWKHLLCRTALLTRIEDGSGAAAAAVQHHCRCVDVVGRCWELW